MTIADHAAFQGAGDLGAFRGRDGGQQGAPQAPRPAAADGPGRGDPVCPVDLPVMLSDSAGKGVLIEAVCHSKPSSSSGGARTALPRVGLLGDQDPARGDLRPRHARSCVEAVRDRQDRRRQGGGDPAELLRMLPDWRALIIRMNLSPVVVKVRPAWRRLAYRAGRHPLPVPRLYPAGDSAAAWASLLLPEPALGPGLSERPRRKAGPLAKVGTDGSDPRAGDRRGLAGKVREDVAYCEVPRVLFEPGRPGRTADRRPPMAPSR